MVEALSSGLASVKDQTNKNKQEFNSMREHGGEDCLMAKVNTKKAMVHLPQHLGDFYLGHFKNGLKHGQGT